MVECIRAVADLESKTPATTACWNCRHPVAPTDRYCSFCANGQGAYVQWYYRPVWIALLTLTVMGPLVLPLIWRTPLLGRVGKVIASLLVIALTAYVAWELSVGISELEQLLEA